MSKTANLHVRIEPEIKEQAEAILSSLGISPSSAVSMFYRQIIIHHRLHFEAKPANPQVDISKISQAELNEMLEKGYADCKAGRARDVKSVFADIRKGYGI